jgi:hypothetical protein
MKLRRPAIELVLMIQASLFIASYTFGLCVITGSLVDDFGYFIAGCFLVSTLCLPIDYPRVKLAVGNSLILVGSCFLYTPVTFLTGSVLGITGFAI